MRVSNYLKLDVRPFLVSLLFSPFLVQCGDVQDPAFVERSRQVRVDLSVGEDSQDATIAAATEDLSSGTAEGAAPDYSVPVPIDEDQPATNDGSAPGSATDGATDGTTDGGAMPGTSTGGGDYSDGGSTGGNTDPGSSTGDNGGGKGNTGDNGSVGGGNGGDFDDDSMDVAEGELGRCGKHFRVKGADVIVAGQSNESRKITSNSVVAIKVNGNKSHLDLNLVGNSKVKGLCLFVTGNQSSATVNIGIALQGLVYYGRGNQSSSQITVDKSGSIGGMIVDLAGNSASLKISGEGDVKCADARLHGHNAQFQCK